MMAAMLCRLAGGLSRRHPGGMCCLGRRWRTGVFGPEEYGITGLDPKPQPSMADLDRDERVVSRIAGLNPAWYVMSARPVISHRPCPAMLVVTGTPTRWPRQRR